MTDCFGIPTAFDTPDYGVQGVPCSSTSPREPSLSHWWPPPNMPATGDPARHACCGSPRSRSFDPRPCATTSASTTAPRSGPPATLATGSSITSTRTSPPQRHDPGFYLLIRVLTLHGQSPVDVCDHVRGHVCARVEGVPPRVPAPVLSVTLFLVAGFYFESYNIARQWFAIACDQRPRVGGRRKACDLRDGDGGGRVSP